MQNGRIVRIARPLLIAALLAGANGAHAQTAQAQPAREQTPREQTLSLRIQDGRATLDARDVTVKQILDEWARQTGAIVVGGDSGVSSERVTLYLAAVPERAALDLVLRQMSGYILAEGRVNGSAPTIGRIFIMPRTPTAQGQSVAPSLLSPLVAERDVADPLVVVDQALGMPQAGLAGPEQELVDIAEGLRDQPTDSQPQTKGREAAKALPVTPARPFGVSGSSVRPGIVSPVPPLIEK